MRGRTLAPNLPEKTAWLRILSGCGADLKKHAVVYGVTKLQHLATLLLLLYGKQHLQHGKQLLQHGKQHLQHGKQYLQHGKQHLQHGN